ncbi:MAG: nucleotide sugar dehydrogenase [Dehalococcoidia bacterium]
MKYDWEQSVVCVVGLGYVGFPLAQVFSKSLKVVGFDIDRNKVNKLSQGNSNRNLLLTTDAKEINKADFILIAVPTPVTKAKEPDLSYVQNASRVVSQNMKKGSVVILESSVYPGVTEDVMKPILEESGMKCGQDFKIGYSPERINPGDKNHSIDRVTKVVSGMDQETTDLVAELYGKVTPQVFKAKDIKTAEAAKIIENIQRDINIALMNELSIIFSKLGLSTRDVLDAASTKWNFNRYSPGLVGGHCIPVDPYYLVYKAKELGYHPQVILAGRAINDYMPKHVAEMTIKALNNVGKVIKGSRVLIMGLTYKENVDDTRETPVKEIIAELKEYGVEVLGYDPLLDNIEGEFGIKPVKNLEQIKKVDGIIIAVAHDAFRNITLDYLQQMSNSHPILIDIRAIFDQQEAIAKGIYYHRL